MVNKALPVVADPDQAKAWREAFGAQVRSTRTARGLSQMALAHAAGLHPTYISGIERGVRNVALVNIHLIASALDVQPADLLNN